MPFKKEGFQEQVNFLTYSLAWQIAGMESPCSDASGVRRISSLSAADPFIPERDTAQEVA